MTQPLSAHGKVFLAGEYAVLDGAAAVVAGVDRALHASWEPARNVQLVHRPSGLVWDGGAPPEELRFAAHAVEICEPRQGFRLVYEDDFAEGGVKLGLGGSAAACVIAVKAAFAADGRELSDRELVRLASQAHFETQGGQGSGADVAASALGGVLRFQQSNATRLRTPDDMRLLLAFTGKAADSRALVRKVREFKEGDPRRWTAVKGEIAAQSDALADALENGARDAALDAIRGGAAAMARLGEAAGAGIVTAELTLACAIATAAGAAAKPSGAGGGDCAVILAFGDEARDRAEAAVSREFPVFRVAPA